MVHVEDLFTAMADFQNEMRRAGYNKEKIDAARAKFRAFCEEHNLPVDFTER
jgi:hypothetical protein